MQPLSRSHPMNPSTPSLLIPYLTHYFLFIQGTVQDLRSQLHRLDRTLYRIEKSASNVEDTLDQIVQKHVMEVLGGEEMSLSNKTSSSPPPQMYL